MNLLIIAGAVLFGAAITFTWALCRSAKNGDLMMEECTRVDALKRLLERHE